MKTTNILRLRSGFIFVFISIRLLMGQADQIPPPAFEGKPLGHWLAHMASSNFSWQGFEIERGFPEKYASFEQAEEHQCAMAETRRKAPQAITAIGLVSLPYLYRMLLYDDPPAVKLEFLWKPDDGIERDESADVIRGTAVVAFECLKMHREIIEPQLRVLLLQPGLNNRVKGSILGALNSIGAPIKDKGGKNPADGGPKPVL